MGKVKFNHQQIKDLLSSDIKPAEIARMVGCTRELVRQLDLQYFGMTGRERSRNRQLALEKKQRKLRRIA
jgi:hypothetical protein